MLLFNCKPIFYFQVDNIIVRAISVPFDVTILGKIMPCKLNADKALSNIIFSDNLRQLFV